MELVEREAAIEMSFAAQKVLCVDVIRKNIR
jgi:hypothetical protein